MSAPVSRTGALLDIGVEIGDAATTLPAAGEILDPLCAMIGAARAQVDAAVEAERADTRVPWQMPPAGRYPSLLPVRDALIAAGAAIAMCIARVDAIEAAGARRDG
jgi:hypothetical protein